MVKIGFFGTPEIAAYCLDNLCGKYDVKFVVTQSDKKYGRNQKIRFCSCKEQAVCKEIPVLQPQNLTEEEFFSELKKYNADIFVVVAYGKIIPLQVFSLPKYKTINLHPSMLPKYRGAAPVEWALINGEKSTGITIQTINEDLDAGDIILQEEIFLNMEMNAAGLYNIVLPKGADLLERAIDLIVSGEANPQKQNHTEATYCKKINREIAHLNWNNSALEIHNLIRGLNPKPVAWTTFNNKNLKIYKSFIVTNELDIVLKPGEVAKYDKKRLLVGTGNGLLEILSLQPESKKQMDAPSFLNGYRIATGQFFV